MTLHATLSDHAVTPVPPRARGALGLKAKRRGAETVIADLRQEGSLKALFPKVRGDALDAVFLNTAGGLTGGDHMSMTVEADADAHVVLSSQAAERAYRAQSGETAHVDVTLRICPGGRIDWIPQETILFDQSALRRKIDVHLADQSTVLLVEPVVFGRHAMGEDVRSVSLQDQWRIWRGQELVLADAIRLVGDAKELMARHAIGLGAGAMATVLLADPSAQTRLSQLPLSGASGASLIAEDLLLVRLLAADGFALRQQLIPVIEALADVPLPRVWKL